jgi:hypothetical protein
VASPPVFTTPMFHRLWLVLTLFVMIASVRLSPRTVLTSPSVKPSFEPSVG